jgi:cobalt/nickel transport protein
MSVTTDTRSPVERRSRRLLILVLVLVSLVLAVGVSSFASAHPDGLEYVAGQLGFEDTAGDHATAGSPVADYEAAGVQDARLATGLAGLVGVTVTAAVAFALFWALRRKS